MILKKRLSYLGVSVACSLLILVFLPHSSFAQRDPADLTAFLLDGADCVLSGSSSSSRLYTEVKPLSIDRQVFDRLFSMRARASGGSSTITCRADPQKFSVIDLQMGVHDDSARYGTNMVVNVYQGGNLRHTYNNVQAGTIINTVLDLNDSEIPRNSNSFAVEIFNCQTSDHCYLQFVEARLYPQGDTVSFRSSETTTSSAENSQSSDILIDRTATQPIESVPNTSTRRDPSTPEPESSRQDPNSGNGILTNILERVLDSIFD